MVNAGVAGNSRFDGGGLWVRGALVLAAGAMVVWAASRASAAGASLTGALDLIARLPRWQVLALALLWLIGLGIHTLVLSASMPGLTHGRALLLNLSGSAVSNVLPLGGVAGTALNLAMTRSWGHSQFDFARFVVVSKACDVAAKLFLPLVALVWLCAAGAITAAQASGWALPAIAAFLAGALLVRALGGRSAPLLRVVNSVARVCVRLRLNRGRAIGDTWPAAIRSVLNGTGSLVRRRRAQLLTGMTGYWFAQAALLWCCLLSAGMTPTPAVVLGALAIERALTLLLITPGGAGPAEAGLVTVLIALGGEPTGSLAAALLYRAFVFAAEIPVGGAAILGWWAVRRLRRRDGTPPSCG